MTYPIDILGRAPITRSTDDLPELDRADDWRGEDLIRITGGQGQKDPRAARGGAWHKCRDLWQPAARGQA